MGMLGKRGQRADGAVMAVRPGTGEFQAELLQAEAVQLSALNTMTPPRAIGCVCTHATICAALPDCTPSPSPLLLLPGLGRGGGGQLVPRLPSWRSGLTGAL